MYLNPWMGYFPTTSWRCLMRVFADSSVTLTLGSTVAKMMTPSFSTNREMARPQSLCTWNQEIFSHNLFDLSSIVDIAFFFFFFFFFFVASSSGQASVTAINNFMLKSFDRYFSCSVRTFLAWIRQTSSILKVGSHWTCLNRHITISLMISTTSAFLSLTFIASFRNF